MGMRGMPTEFTSWIGGRIMKKRFAYWLGRINPGYREHWFRATGTWLWGLQEFIDSRPVGPRGYSPISSGQFKAYVEQMTRTD